MGLDFSHGEAHWSYSGFMQFRRRLAREIGIDLDQMQGFNAASYRHPIRRKSDTHPMQWNKITDPIITLLNHSDCDGSIQPEDAPDVAGRLRQLVEDWSDEDYDKIHALRLADGLEEACEDNKELEFC